MMGWDSSYGPSMMAGWGLGWLIFLFFGLLILIGVVLLIVWAVRSGSRGPEHGGPVAHGYPPHAPVAGGGYSFRDEASEIARRRLAEGQITPDQYNEIMACLSRQS